MSKDKFTAAEWELVKDAPFWVNRVLTAADGKVSFFARRREAKALEKAMKEYKTGNAFLKDIVADDSDPAKGIEKASVEDAELALGRIATIVDQKLGDDDVKALRAFLVGAGRAVALSSREGGVGMSGTISDKEEAALKRIESALRPSAYTQAKPAAKPAPQPAAATAATNAATGATAKPKPAPAAPKRDDDAKQKENLEQARQEAEERQQKAAAEREAKTKAEADAKAKQKLEEARKEAEERQKQADAEREAKAKTEAEAKMKAEAEAKAKAEAEAESAQALEAAEAKAAPRYTQFIAEHTVQPGDNLSFISQRYYGTQANFLIIYEANRDVIGDNKNLIKPGQVLKIPKL